MFHVVFRLGDGLWPGDLDAPQTDELMSGLGVGSAAIALAWVLGRRSEAWTRRDIAGVWVPLALAHMYRSGMAGAVALVAAALFVADRLVARSAPRASLVLLAASVVAIVAALRRSVPAGLESAAYLIALVAAIVLASAAWRNRPGIAIAMLTIASAGNYVNVPDTEQVAFVAAGLAALAVAAAVGSGRVSRWESLGAAAAMVVASGAIGARGDPVTFWGVVGSLAAFGAEPIARTVRRRTSARALVLIVVHLCVVAAASRLLPRADLAPPWITTLALLAGATVILVASPRRADTAQAQLISTQTPVGKTTS